MRRFFVWLVVLMTSWLAVYQSNHYEIQISNARVIPIFITDQFFFSKNDYIGKSGSVDVLSSISGKVEFKGWISPDIDEIHVIVTPGTSSFVQRVELLPRPDVLGSRQEISYLYSGFETFLSNSAVKKIVCIVFANEISSQVVYATGEIC